MNRMQRFKLALARLLLAGSGHEVVVSKYYEKAQSDIWQLSRYVRSAGGLSTRINARRKIERSLDQVESFIRGSRSY